MPSPTDRTTAPRVSRLPSSFIPHPSSFSSRLAFTLTELLIVITIIAILAGLGSYAAVQALGTAKQTRMKTELDSIDAAFKAYKEKYGSYPPCNLTNPASNTALLAHVARAFPRYPIANLPGDLATAGVDTTYFRPDQALVFWLQGFSPDPANPFITPGKLQITAGSAGAAVAVTPLFQFDPTRLWQVPSIMNGGGSAVISPTSGTPLVASYYPQGSLPPSSSAAPFLYWDAGTTNVTNSGGTTTVASNYGSFTFTGPKVPAAAPPSVLPVVFNSQNTGGTPQTLLIFSNAGLALPYWNDIGANPGQLDSTESWINPDSFQIISAGMDGVYGNSNTSGAILGTITRLYPTGAGYDTSSNLADDDNMTNFCAKARIGDAKP